MRNCREIAKSRGKCRERRKSGKALVGNHVAADLKHLR
jgi:hypothetical protein